MIISARFYMTGLWILIVFKLKKSGFSRNNFAKTNKSFFSKKTTYLTHLLFLQNINRPLGNYSAVFTLKLYIFSHNLAQLLGGGDLNGVSITGEFEPTVHSFFVMF